MRPIRASAVGAALLCEGGWIITGCNVENASFGLTVCAERNAINTAIDQGLRRFSALVVATSSSPPGPPCGMCRQTLTEFCLDLPIRLVNTQGEHVQVSLARLMPRAFRWKGVKEAP
jgi:cytidine deaminase